MTATGQLYPCLGGGERVDLRAALRSADPDAALVERLDRDLVAAIAVVFHGFRQGFFLVNCAFLNLNHHAVGRYRIAVQNAPANAG